MIKMSSPNINNGIIAGSIICYASVIVYGLDARFLSKYGIQIGCNVSKPRADFYGRQEKIQPCPHMVEMFIASALLIALCNFP